jgi:peptide deformylase
MAFRRILLYPSKELVEKSTVVTDFTEAQSVVEDLKDTLNVAGGVGLSAPQIGIHTRVIFVNTPEFSGEMINPVIVETSDAVSMSEGCLSFPGIFENIDRYSKVKVEYKKLDGKKIVRELTGLAAQVVQHEIEHLDGKLLVDQLSRLKRQMISRKIQKTKRKSSLLFLDVDDTKTSRVKKNTGLSRKEIKNRRRRRKQNR